MTQKTRKSSQTANKRLKSNPNVSVTVVKQYQKLEKELHRLGVDTHTRPHYTLSHPFDWTVSQSMSKHK